MKKILCFGDSNTYGFIAGDGGRYDKNTRWTGLLQQKLVPDYEIIEAGCNNRNGFIEHPDGDDHTGYKVLPKYLKQNPDIVIIAIGINDIQKFYKPTLNTISDGLISMIKTIKTAQIILIAPPVLHDNILDGMFSFQFDKESIETSKYLPELYKTIAKDTGCHFFDFNNEIKLSDKDGLHYPPESHKYIADKLADFIMTL